MNDSLNNILKIANQIRRHMDPFIRQMDSVYEFANQIHKHMDPVILSAFESETFEHEVFFKIFPEGFDKTKLENDWDKIRIFLKARWSDYLMEDSRTKERLEQIYKAQDVGAYIAVCRAVYPEIENLLRKELLLKNDEFSSKFDNEPDKQKRSRLLNEEFSKIKKSLSIYFGFTEEDSLDQVGILTFIFLYELEKSFESYDPKSNFCNDSKKKLRNNRHFHCHGWSEEATFVDALNALLILDMAMCLIEKYQTTQKNLKNK